MVPYGSSGLEEKAMVKSECLELRGVVFVLDGETIDVLIKFCLLSHFPSLQASGADALELNLSCPHGMGERGMGLACGQVSTRSSRSSAVAVSMT